MDELRQFLGDTPDRTIEVRATLWPVVNWLLPITLTPAGSGADLLALRSQPLPAIPRTGEWLRIGDARVEVDAVVWDGQGRITVRLSDITVTYEFVETIKTAGWQVITREDPDEWANAFKDE